MKKSFLIIVGSVVVIFLFFQSFFSLLGEEESYVIAHGMFRSYAKAHNMKEDDFISPMPLGDNNSSPFITLSWRSKSQPSCSIEVSVNRDFLPEARPSWSCAISEGLKNL